MDAAMDTAGVDQTSKAILMKYFRHMSYFLVAGRSYTNCTHLIASSYLTGKTNASNTDGYAAWVGEDAKDSGSPVVREMVGAALNAAETEIATAESALAAASKGDSSALGVLWFKINSQGAPQKLVEVPASATLCGLRQAIARETGVAPGHQHLSAQGVDFSVADTTLISSMGLADKSVINMVSREPAGPPGEAGAALRRIRRAGVHGRTPFQALALVLHAFLMEQGFVCTGLHEGAGAQGGARVAGFAAPVRDVPEEKFVPEGWNAEGGVAMLVDKVLPAAAKQPPSPTREVRPQPQADVDPLRIGPPRLPGPMPVPGMGPGPGGLGAPGYGGDFSGDLMPGGGPGFPGGGGLMGPDHPMFGGPRGMHLPQADSKCEARNLAVAAAYKGWPYFDAIPNVSGEFTLEAEWFDMGGQGVAYNNIFQANDQPPNFIRLQEPIVKEGKDVPVALQINDVQGSTDPSGKATEGDGEIAVGMGVAGEWMRYTINVPVGGTFETVWRVAVYDASGADVAIETKLTVGTGNEADPCALAGAGGLKIAANTGYWKAFETFAGANIDLPSGEHILTICLDKVAGFEVNWVRFGQAPAAGDPAQPATPTNCAATGSACSADMPCCAGTCSDSFECTAAADAVKQAQSSAAAVRGGVAALACAAAAAAALHW
ncbi:hypothetical protein JKP88DRAFT_352878 [Tribonema minus]|uniref:Uncharacterized protein n=1 Tax=Tribonema minus TaxID=303371 RepID=A0A835ZEP6_9STRA|nr:hypothetical protein JKP88DRAFT_352878 [Tribonema minus]